MNDPNKRKADRGVHDRCSYTYLLGELKILQPEILITQGDPTNEILGVILKVKPIYTDDLPVTFEIINFGRPIVWMPMLHPAHHLHEIREYWHVYEDAVRKWAEK